MSRRTYTQDFKDSAARLVIEQGYSVKQAAKSLGVDPASIREWDTAASPPLRAVGRRPADRLAAVPAEPFRLRDNGIGHQRGQADRSREPAGSPARPAAGGQRPVIVGLGVRRRQSRPRRRPSRRSADGTRPGSRSRPHRRRRIRVELLEILEARRLGPGPLNSLCRRHQSEYLGTGGAGGGPSTVNHLRYNVLHVPSRRMRSSVPFTKRTRPVFCRLMPMP